MEAICKGRPIFGGIASGRVKIVASQSDACDVTSDHIVFSENLSPPLAGAARHARGFVLVGLEADHTVTYIQEIWKPGLLIDELPELEDGTSVTLDCNNGELHLGESRSIPAKIRPLCHKLRTRVYLQLPQVRQLGQGRCCFTRTYTP